MGMYDKLVFKYKMPDGYEEKDHYHVTGLDFNLHEYEIDVFGQLILVYGYLDGKEIKHQNSRITETAFATGSEEINGKTIYHRYSLFFEDGLLVKIEHLDNQEIPRTWFTFSNERNKTLDEKNLV